MQGEAGTEQGNPSSTDLIPRWCTVCRGKETDEAHTLTGHWSNYRHKFEPAPEPAPSPGPWTVE